MPGFYDGDGTYRIRFMPDHEGEWTLCDAVQDGRARRQDRLVHGSRHRRAITVRCRSRNKFHFAYADGTAVFSLRHDLLRLDPPAARDAGGDAGDAEDDTLQQDPDGRLPQGLPYNINEPLHADLRASADGKVDFDRPNPVAFRHFEKQVAALRELGIEADIIIFHPYDRWGYAT